MDLTQDGYFYNDDVLNFVAKDNYSACYICINCSVTGYPMPIVTWQYHDNSNPYKPVITNESDSTSDLFLLDNGKVCLQWHAYMYVHECDYVYVKLCILVLGLKEKASNFTVCISWMYYFYGCAIQWRNKFYAIALLPTKQVFATHCIVSCTHPVSMDVHILKGSGSRSR